MFVICFETRQSNLVRSVCVYIYVCVCVCVREEQETIHASLSNGTLLPEAHRSLPFDVDDEELKILYKLPEPRNSKFPTNSTAATDHGS